MINQMAGYDASLSLLPKSNVPIRICGSKTRTGCRTCKQRHVKCDEHRPTCQRCQKVGRPCVWESVHTATQRTPSSGLHEKGKLVVADQRHSHFVSPGLDNLVNPFGSRSTIELIAVKHFTAYLGKEFAGCFSDDVWCQFLPRVAHHEPSIWHAVAAVGLLDTGSRLAQGVDDANPNLSKAIRQYSKAMQELNMRLSFAGKSLDRDVILLSCILFAIFECLQSNYPAALRHIGGGMKLLAEWRVEAPNDDPNTGGAYFDHKKLQPIFMSLESQAIQMGVIALRDLHTVATITDQIQIPAAFLTSQEAYHHLNHIFNQLTHWCCWSDNEDYMNSGVNQLFWITEGHRLRALLKRWESAFDTLRQIYYPNPSILLLLIHSINMRIYFEKEVDGPGELAWDKYWSLFEKVVTLGELYMQQTETTGRAQGLDFQPRFAFTIGMDIVLPMFMICAKCRDSVIRRRALKVLKSCERKEGIWDSALCAPVVERMIDMEESNALDNGYIPENVRIIMLDVRLKEEGGGEITHKKRVVDEYGQHRIEAW